jgi:hypothetical protein
MEKMDQLQTNSIFANFSPVEVFKIISALKQFEVKSEVPVNQ